MVSEPCLVDSHRPTAEKFKNKGKASKEPLGKTQTAEKRKSKGKAIAEPLSCPPATKIQKIGEKIKEDGSKSLSKAGTVPRKKKQGRLPSRKYSSKNALLQEYIAQQRAYFAEIDAFELPEEEVHSISDLD